jgi:hypothetical protein
LLLQAAAACTFGLIYARPNLEPQDRARKNEAAMSDPVKIYCETSTLEGNVRQDTPEVMEAKAAIQALKKIHADGLIKFYGSRVNLREVGNTKDATRRAGLTADYQELAPILKDERVLGFSAQYDQLGGFISNVIVSDTQDEKMRDSIISIGIDQKDAEHLTQAICNDFDYFLTRDQGIIRYRDQIETKFPPIKIRTPPELLAELRSSQKLL